MLSYLASFLKSATRTFVERRSATPAIKQSQSHCLHFESLEARTLLAGDMAEIVGTVLNDLQGDAVSANDVAAANVTVNLYRDGGNGTFDNGGGDDVVAAPAELTDASGRYSFAGIGAGTYFVEITPPANQHTRRGGDVKTVVVTPAEAEGVIGRTIDGFGTAQLAEARPPLPSSDPSTMLDPNVLGGQRDLFVELTEGDDEFTRVALQSGGGLLRLASDPDVTGNARVIWDGVDDNAEEVNPTGLPGIDLTRFEGKTMTGISLTVGADHPNTLVKLKLYTDANNWSEYTTTVPESEGGRATKNAVFQFADAPTNSSGGGADLSNIGAIELNFEGVTAVDGQVSVIELVGLTPKTADFTVFDKLSLGNHVWGELVNDGVRSGSEQGIAGVKLNLFEDKNDDQIFTQGVDELLGQETTDANGDYLFTDLFPGKYLVQVDPSNFVGDGALVGLASSTGGGVATDPDDNINGDDNGDPVSGLGVVSRAITLTSGAEPTNDGDNDPNTNLTVDFGFFGFDLVLDKSVQEVAAVPGEQLNFSVVIENAGPSTAENVVFTDTLPPEVSYVSGSVSTGATLVPNGSGQLVADLGDLAAGQKVTVNILVDVNQNTSGIVKNIAEVSADEEADTSNNMDMVTVPIEPLIDLSIEKEDSTDPVEAGQSFSYTLEVTNTGPSNATGVVITDTLPAGVTFESATPLASSVVGDTVQFDVGNLAVGEKAEVTITVRVDEEFSGTLLNEAWVSGNEKEVREDNNHADELTEVVIPMIDLEISKIDTQDPVQPGEVFSYVITARNNGPDEATGVVITDTLPNGVSFQSATPVPTSVVDDTLTFDVGDMAVGESVSIRINVQVDSDFTGTLINEASISGNEEETRQDNNHAEEPTLVVIPPASISGTVFVDRNDNGQLESGERRISGVEINLVGTDFQGNPISRTTFTGSNGNYTFQDLMPGTYSVRQTQPAKLGSRELFDGKDQLGDNGDGLKTGLDGLKAPDLNANDDRDSDAFEGIVLAAGNDGSDYNFGELMAGLSKRNFIHELVWNI